MMKKLFLICLIGLCFFPAFAQEGKLIKAGADAANNGLAQQVGRQLTEQTLHAAKVPNTVLAQISNLPGKPLVQVRMEAPLSTVMQMVPARVLVPSQAYDAINPGSYLRLPTVFTSPEKAVYRGLRIRKLNDLRTMLTEGMPVQKTKFGVVYGSYAPSVALAYALPPGEWAVYENLHEIDLELPVMVKIPVTRGLRIFNAPQSTGFANEVYFYENLRAKRISDMMVFLEVGGKPGWYKVVLEKGKLVFVPAPVTDIPGYIDHW